MWFTAGTAASAFLGKGSITKVGLKSGFLKNTTSLVGKIVSVTENAVNMAAGIGVFGDAGRKYALVNKLGSLALGGIKPADPRKAPPVIRNLGEAPASAPASDAAGAATSGATTATSGANTAAKAASAAAEEATKKKGILAKIGGGLASNAGLLIPSAMIGVGNAISAQSQIKAQEREQQRLLESNSLLFQEYEEPPTVANSTPQPQSAPTPATPQPGSLALASQQFLKSLAA